MNIIRARQEQRKMKISMIADTLKLAKKKGKEVDMKKLILECCAEWGASRRTVLEYIEIAKISL